MKNIAKKIEDAARATFWVLCVVFKVFHELNN